MNNNTVIIVGAGMVGLSLAAALAQAEIEVVVIDKKPPELEWQKDSLDSRVSAINRAVYYFLNNLEVWSQLAKESWSPFVKMQVWDHIGGGNIEFTNTEVDQKELGFIVENREIIRILWEKLQQSKQVHIVCPATPHKIILQSDHVELIVEQQAEPIRGALIVGADGPQSWVREQMQVIVNERPYRHEALIAVVKSKQAHQQTAYQNFLKTGPLALLPLADQHHEAIVWSAEREFANYLVSLTDDLFNRELTNASEYRLGSLVRVTDLKKFSLTQRHAKNYVLERMALIGDAAHTLHPLAGQGANLGFMDAACLAQSLIDTHRQHKDVGSLRPLRRYERWRKTANNTMLTAMQIFQELFATQSLPIIHLRSLGLNLTNRLTWVKNCFTHYAMGEIADLPELLKKSENH